jgi:hypothetical protein
MDNPLFSLAFVMVKESFAVPAILFYLASNATKNKCQDHVKYWARKVKFHDMSQYLADHVSCRE